MRNGRKTRIFQFHYGTIKSMQPNLDIQTFHNFNSTMVRLKELPFVIYPYNELFQFHYGTIKRGQLGIFNLVFTNFNSTMVRLKEAKNRMITLSASISIPLWYD